ncbi:MAG: MFS transporter [Clostridiales bacterium]|nr:MFS transporter [Clostridiales bacterium]
MKNQSNLYVSVTSMFLMGFYWFGNAFILTYASVYLLDRGLNNTEIGIVLSVGAVLSIFLQGIPSAMADSLPQVSLKSIMTIFLIGELALTIRIPFCGADKPMLMIAYALLEALDWSLLAYINTLSMDYENSGYQIDFSVVRAFGSALYGIASLLLGIGSSHFGLGILMPGLFLVRFVTLIQCLLMVNPHIRQTSSSFSRQKRAPSGYLSLFHDHPRLPFLLFGFFCLWISGTSTNNYLIHTIHKVGGNNTNLGVISSTSAWMEVPFMLLCGMLLHRHSSSTLLRCSAFFYILKPTIMLLATSIPMVALGQYMQGPSYAMFTIASVYYMNHVVPPKDSAKAQAILGISTKGMSGIVANLVSGIILDHLGINGMLAFCMLCTICGFCFILHFTIMHQKTGVSKQV